ncbi:MAG: putative OB-fold protein [Haloarculaceae archaeon]|jgi:uncharacterized OB-fold protein
MGLLELLRGDTAGPTVTQYECRNCGTTLSPDAEECSTCGSNEIAEYTL